VQRPSIIRYFAALVASSLLFFGCSACRPRYGLPPLPPPASSFEGRARLELSKLSLEEKCGQVLLVGVEGEGRPSAAGISLIKNLGPGGILLFGFNVGPEASGLGPFVGGLQDAAASSGAGLPLIVSIDHEGGGVFRFKGGLTRIPSAAEVGQGGPAYAALLGRRAGLELKALGVNLALAPVVELLDDENAPFLGSRCYGSDAAKVDATAGAYIAGLESAGVAATAKHFPGNANSDPHKSLSTLGAGKKRLEKDYFARFSAARDSGVACVLLSHVLVPAIDSAHPATLSSRLILGELKERLRFDGVALTDDLYMKALAAKIPPERAAVEALAAGADLLMLSDGYAAPKLRDSILAAVKDGRLSEARLDDAVLRILELKLRFSMADGLDPKLRASRLAALSETVAESGREIAAFDARAAHRSSVRSSGRH
jgi:beta-N-acetylhexosaminidase